jgi:hypothetical protein
VNNELQNEDFEMHSLRIFHKNKRGKGSLITALGIKLKVFFFLLGFETTNHACAWRGTTTKTGIIKKEKERENIQQNKTRREGAELTEFEVTSRERESGISERGAAAADQDPPPIFDDQHSNAHARNRRRHEQGQVDMETRRVL